LWVKLPDTLNQSDLRNKGYSTRDRRQIFYKKLNFFGFYNKSLKRRCILDTYKIKQDRGVIYFWNFKKDESNIF